MFKMFTTYPLTALPLTNESTHLYVSSRRLAPPISHIRLFSPERETETGANVFPHGYVYITAAPTHKHKQGKYAYAHSFTKL